MSLLKNVTLNINDNTTITVDFIFVTTEKSYDFEIDKLSFSDKNGEFSLKSKDHNTQRLYLNQSADAVDAYIGNNDNWMLVEAANTAYAEALALKNV